MSATRRQQQLEAAERIAHLCECGCGKPTTVYWVKGKGWVPRRLLRGHWDAAATARLSATKQGHPVSARTRAKLRAAALRQPHPRKKQRSKQPCSEPGCQTLVWSGRCLVHVDPTGAVRIKGALSSYLADHDDAEAADALRELQAADARPERAVRLVRMFRKDPSYRDLRRRVFPGRQKGAGGFTRDDDDRFFRAFERIYESERGDGRSTGHRVPKLANLIAGDGRIVQRLPDGFDGIWGVVKLCAAALQLDEAKVRNVDICRMFGWPVDRNVQRGRSHIVSQLIAVGKRLRHAALRSSRYKSARYRPRWERAMAEAAEYLWGTEPYSARAL